MKNIVTYTSSPKEIADKILFIADNYMFENKTDEATIDNFSHHGVWFDKVKRIDTSENRKEIGFLSSHNPTEAPLMLSLLLDEEQQQLSAGHPLHGALACCQSLMFKGKVLSTIGTHRFVQGENISSIHKELYGDFRVLRVGKERSLLHPFGRDVVTLRDIKNTVQRPFKIYPSKMKDVSIAVKPYSLSHGYVPSMYPRDVNSYLSNLSLKDFDIELSDHISLSPEDFNPNIENQYSSNLINKVSIRNGRVALFHMKNIHDIDCLSKSGFEKVEHTIKSKLVYLEKFSKEVFEKQEAERLHEKSRKLQDELSKLPGMEIGKTIHLENGIPLDDLLGIDSIGDMMVNDVTYLANPHGHAIFSVSDGERDIPFTRMFEWNQSQVFKAVQKQVEKNVDLSRKEEIVKVMKESSKTSWVDKNHFSMGFDRPIMFSYDDFVNERVSDAYFTRVHFDSGAISLNTVGGNPHIDFSQLSEKDKDRLVNIIKEQQSLFSSQNNEVKNVADKSHDNIEYDGKKWPVRSVVLPSTGEEVLIGTVALEQALLPDDGHSEWKDRKAQAVDERIFYYVTEEEFNFPAELLAAIVEREALDVDNTISLDGEKLEVGMKVIWNDPDESTRDLNRVWTIDNINGEVISISDEYSEAEVTARELTAYKGEQQEERLLSDEDIEKQYSDYKVTGIKFYKQVQPDAWSGVVDLEFPNATHPDFNETMVNPFISYDKEGKKIAFDNWMPDDVYKGVCGFIREERPKHLVVEAIIERTTDAGAKAFTPEQQDIILSYLKGFDSTDQKMQALSPLWEKAKEDDRMKNVVGFWKDDAKAELNDLASGIVRENGQGLKV